ncbi:UPF0481 protein At3g47200-like [Cornus florida]|uniref:UPF0481 protein At3g47200-like n=1 Tax=Cornus florida TaxID=4283 RepID=UPI002897097F|nr:UPF0481 protein At3g47200-like [Cornus florida]
MSMASQISTMDQLTDYLGIPFSGLPFSKMGYIPSYLRTDVNCFKPSVVSIGPYFRHFSLKIEDAFKLQMASDLIQPESFNTFKSKMEKVIEKDLIHVFQQNPVHLLDILRRKIIRFPNTNHHSCTRVNSLGGSLASASKMRSWGISFAVQGNLEMRRITFKNGCFHLPKLFICEFSESLFVNLMAYEYSFGIKGNDEISTYMWLMGLWLSDEESVSILRNNVVLSLYSDEKIVQLFKRVTQERMPNMKLLEVTHGLVPNTQLLEEVVKLTKIYQDSNVMLLRRWAFKIQEICFSSIWRTVACVSVFVMTIKQIVGVTCKG